MNDLTDQQLLSDYAEHHSEAAFAELVRRHVDFVYSAALRMVRNPHLAEDVTQGVFVAAAESARQLVDCSVLPGWLHRTTQHLAANAVRSDVRRRAREQEAAVMNEILSARPDTNWEHIAPHLDDALGELDDSDRDAVLLRYFKNHDLRTVGATLGISDDAAQKRVSRAVERLREFFAKRGVTVGASGLAVVISANAVQAAPVGLAFTISTAAALTGTTLATTATVTATKAIAMTALQKTIVTATIVVLAGVGIYEARQAAQLREQVETFKQQQASLIEQIKQFETERNDAANRLAWQVDELAKANSNKPELLRLRGEVGMLRQQLKNLSQSSDTLNETKTNQPSVVFESVLVDGQTFEINATAGEAAEVAIPADGEQLEIHYKFWGLATPHQNRVAHRLLGFEADWTDIGTNRVARYRKLPAGRYPFSVKVVDSNGTVTIGSATLNITVGAGAQALNNPVGAMLRILEPVRKTYAAANAGREPADFSDLLPYISTPEQQTAYENALEIMKASKLPESE